jgi:predicted nucleic acid-binding protein
VGIILDSSVLIASERRGKNAHYALKQIAERVAGQDLAISVVTVIELAHGIARSDTLERREMRRLFLSELIEALPVQPVTTTIALRAGQMDGDRTSKGVRIALSDLLIGVTALELGYKVATTNLRHFQMIPELEIVIWQAGSSSLS